MNKKNIATEKKLKLEKNTKRTKKHNFLKK